MVLPIFGKSQKSPSEVVKNLKESLLLLERGDCRKAEKVVEDVNKGLQTMKSLIYAQDGNDQHSEPVAQLAQEIYNAHILPLLIRNLIRMEFESKKDVAEIFNNLLRRQLGTRSPTMDYVVAHPDILIALVAGYETPEIALTCGSILRSCVRHEYLSKMVLQHESFYNFFTYVDLPSFDVASDAFSSFKEIITKHKTLCAEFLDANYDEFFRRYEHLLNSDNYVTRRQSLKLLGELLLDRHNFNVMTRYISNPDNLKMMMNLLREKSKSIQFEAFHVFKVFVANPNKPRPIIDILLRNRDKLVDFLGSFHTDRTQDEQFNDEKAYLMKQIQEMKV